MLESTLLLDTIVLLIVNSWRFWKIKLSILSFHVLLRSVFRTFLKYWGKSFISEIQKFTSSTLISKIKTQKKVKLDERKLQWAWKKNFFLLPFDALFEEMGAINGRWKVLFTLLPFLTPRIFFYTEISSNSKLKLFPNKNARLTKIFSLVIFSIFFLQ